MAPSKGMERRGCRLKPSSWLTSVRSAQSEGREAQLGSGIFTRNPVRCWKSNTVKRSLGKGDCVGEPRLNSGWVAAEASAGISKRAATSRIVVRLANEYFSLCVISMAVDDLQGELHMASETLDLTERLVNGCDNEISSAGGRSCFRKEWCCEGILPFF